MFWTMDGAMVTKGIACECAGAVGQWGMHFSCRLSLSQKGNALATSA
jgi:hypothetical protein